MTIALKDGQSQVGGAGHHALEDQGKVKTMPRNTMPKNRSDTSETSGENLMTEQVKPQTHQAVQQTQEAAGQLAEQAKDQAVSLVATQKDRTAQSLSSLAQVLHQTGQSLQDQNQGAVGQLTDKAATQLEHVSGYLHERDMNQLLGEAEDYTRRNPALVLGAAFALGLLAARFLKTSGTGQGSQSFGYSGHEAAGYGYTPSPRYGAGSDRGTYRYQDVPIRSYDVESVPSDARQSPAGTMSRNPGHTPTDADMGAAGEDEVRTGDGT